MADIGDDDLAALDAPEIPIDEKYETVRIFRRERAAGGRRFDRQFSECGRRRKTRAGDCSKHKAVEVHRALPFEAPHAAFALSYLGPLS